MKFEQAREFILEKLKRELPEHLTYHSTEHIKDVYAAAETIADYEGISGDDRLLLLTAVLFHDSGFIIQQKEHESISCDIARECLPDFEYTNEQISTICGMIMATRLPQLPKNLLEQIMCDSDLDYLGRDDFFTIGNKLFNELKVYGIIHNQDEWNNLQIRFLQNHQYFTHTAIRLRKEKKEAHLQLLKYLI
ncbi:MAG: HD domain-containing protein [Bacteroidota bacterium]